MTKHARSCYYRASIHQYNRRARRPLLHPRPAASRPQLVLLFFLTPAQHPCTRPRTRPLPTRFVLGYDVDSAHVELRRKQFPGGMFRLTEEMLPCVNTNSPKNGCQWKGPRYEPPYNPQPGNNPMD